MEVTPYYTDFNEYFFAIKLSEKFPVLWNPTNNYRAHQIGLSYVTSTQLRYLNIFRVSTPAQLSDILPSVFLTQMLYEFLPPRFVPLLLHLMNTEILHSGMDNDLKQTFISDMPEEE
jgi:hypothetical protein